MSHKNIIAFIVLLPALCLANEADSLNYELDEIEVVSSKEHGGIRQQPSAISVINSQQIESRHITSLKESAPYVPNLFIPDYGSRLTSAIYIRGVGSRINTPAVGLYVDNVPYTDKSAFDFPFYDIERIDVLRGPQGTLYGRNTMGGLLRITTRNPFDYQGTDLKLGYNTGDNTRNVALTHYHRPSSEFAFSAGGYYTASDGFFKNDYTGENADESQAAGARMRAIWQLTRRWQLDTNISFDHNSEGAYPYYYYGSLNGEEQYEDNIGKITNNRQNTYRRNMVNAAVNMAYRADRWQLNAITSYQHIADRMFLDQDFLSADIFTLEQRQHINTINEEVIVKNIGNSRWKRVTGANVTYQWLNTKAPVIFRKDGLEWLAGNINSYIPPVAGIPTLSMMGFTDMGIRFNGETMLIDSHCDTPLFSGAMFHQSEVSITDHLTASLGLRLDYELQRLSFDSRTFSSISFRMDNPANEKMALHIPHIDLLKHIGGEAEDDYLQLFPKFSLKYQFNKYNNIYASVSMGQRSGGYNIQMLSDFMESHLRADMIEEVKGAVISRLHQMAEQSSMPSFVPGLVEGILNEKLPQFERAEVSHLIYKPEYSWNYEVGTHLSLFNHALQADAAIFLMNVTDQQVARFTPSGMGRMMTNAGKARSYGAELSLHAQPMQTLTITAAYGFTHATFTRYDDGAEADYSGRRIPFVPEHTAALCAAYRIGIRNPWVSSITLAADAAAAGRIYWNESNTMSQPFYATLGASASIETKLGTLRLWAKNLTNSSYDTFCFESMGREFRQHAAPAHAGIEVCLRF